MFGTPKDTKKTGGDQGNMASTPTHGQAQRSMLAEHNHNIGVGPPAITIPPTKSNGFDAR